MTRVQLLIRIPYLGVARAPWWERVQYPAGAEAVEDSYSEADKERFKKIFDLVRFNKYKDVESKYGSREV